MKYSFFLLLALSFVPVAESATQVGTIRDNVTGKIMPVFADSYGNTFHESGSGNFTMLPSSNGASNYQPVNTGNTSRPFTNNNFMTGTGNAVGTGINALGSGVGAFQSAQNGDYFGAAAQGIDAISALAGSDLGGKLMGTAGNILNGTVGQAGTAAAGAAGTAGGAGGAAGGAGGAGGAGAAVMDIGNILLSVLQMAQLLQQTGVQTNQLQTLNDQLGVNSQELAVTRAVYDAIGTAPSGGSSSGGGGSSGGGSGLSNSLATAVPTSLSSTTGGASSGMASVLQAGGQVGNFIDSKAGSLFDLYSFGQGLMGSIQDFSSDPLGATMDILSMLAGGSPSSKLSNMSAEEMASYGLEVPGALSTQFNGVALQNGQAALDAYAARKARYDSLAAATARSKSLNETAELNTLSSIEGARATSDAVAQSGADAARNAANAELRNQADRKRDLQSDATALLD